MQVFAILNIILLHIVTTIDVICYNNVLNSPTFTLHPDVCFHVSGHPHLFHYYLFFCFLFIVRERLYNNVRV